MAPAHFPAHASTRALELAGKVRDQLQRQPFNDGDFFATEAELAVRYGVSRSVAREAVLRLKALGLLESRRRKGLIVRRPNPARLFSDSLPSLVRSEEDLAELARLRYVIEVGAIELAVTHATPEQIQRLAEVARRFEQLVRKGGTNRRQNKLEVAFHSLILEMTGSPLIAQMQEVLSRFFQVLDRELPHDLGGQRTVWEHHAIVAAIRDRDLDRARVMIRQQFKRLLEFQSPPLAV